MKSHGVTAAFNLGKYYKTVLAQHAVSAPDLSGQLELLQGLANVSSGQLELLQGLANVSTELAMKYSDLKAADRDSEAVSWCEGKIHTEPAGNPQW